MPCLLLLPTQEQSPPSSSLEVVSGAGHWRGPEWPRPSPPSATKASAWVFIVMLQETAEKEKNNVNTGRQERCSSV